MISYVKDTALALAGVREIEFEMELVPKQSMVGAVVLQATVFGLNDMAVPVPALSFDYRSNYEQVVETLSINLELNFVEAKSILEYMHDRSQVIETLDFTRELELG